MKSSKLCHALLLLLLGFLLGSCGGQHRETRIASNSTAAKRSDRYASPPRDAEQAGAARRRALPRTARSYEPGVAEDAPDHASAQAAPWRRPGLATHWGEKRDSHIREVHFHRQSSRPSAVLSVYYDDESGVHAATGLSPDYAYSGVFAVRGGALTISITDDSGAPLAAMQSAGRRYVIGDSGERYQIRIQNHTPGRFEVVTSVDGLDVIDGHEGDYTKRGYLVDPWGSLTIEGFRDSYDSVRAFRFGNMEDSYAARRGKGMNIGVIGVALFEEEGFHWHPRRRRAEPFPGRFAPPPPGW